MSNHNNGKKKIDPYLVAKMIWENYGDKILDPSWFNIPLNMSKEEISNLISNSENHVKVCKSNIDKKTLQTFKIFDSAEELFEFLTEAKNIHGNDVNFRIFYNLKFSGLNSYYGDDHIKMPSLDMLRPIFLGGFHYTNPDIERSHEIYMMAVNSHNNMKRDIRSINNPLGMYIKHCNHIIRYVARLIPFLLPYEEIVFPDNYEDLLLAEKEGYTLPTRVTI